ncbi:helix-turn-helix domain-containing protein [Tautonia rosea]|uniref:helix-turn-helix domain-containing protein n=1 Tax=Tautonia rosea TaxID=2728037 RepID=UPI001473A672|nr:helix-turn-helix domain-containing protein [Tautonia rosea]
MSIRTADFDELASVFPGWDMRLMQLGRGAFQGGVVLSQVGRFQLFEVEGNRSVQVRGARPVRCYEFNVVQERNADAVWRGRTLRPGIVNIRQPGDLIDHRTSESYRSTGLVVDAEFVQRIAASLHGVDAESLLGRSVVSLELRRSRSLDRSLRRVLSRFAVGDDLVPQPHADVEEFLVGWLSEILGCALPEQLREASSLGSRRRTQVVREAEAYMLAHLDRRLSLFEICEVVGVSERTLIYAFRECTGQTPKAYLKALRLNRLRQDLKAADPSTASVCQFARHWGLDHPGALAADYFRQFGERPGQTLHRTR